jgi:hypothetical protein
MNFLPYIFSTAGKRGITITHQQSILKIQKTVEVPFKVRIYLALRAAKTAKVGRKTAAEWAGLSQYTRVTRVIAIFFSATDIDIQIYETSNKPPRLFLTNVFEKRVRYHTFLRT